MINPFDLLGVDLNSSIEDVKHSYYNLALIMHPDRGGTLEEMDVLQKSYDWIKIQLLGVKDANKKYESFETFNNYSNDSNNFSITDIYDECIFDTKKFNAEFEGLNIESELLCEKGYSENDNYIGDDIGNCNDCNNCLTKFNNNDPVIKNFCYINYNNDVAKVTNENKNYTADVPIAMADFLLAYKDSNNSNNIDLSRQARTIESVLEEREIQIEIGE